MSLCSRDTNIKEALNSRVILNILEQYSLLIFILASQERVDQLKKLMCNVICKSNYFYMKIFFLYIIYFS